MYCFKHPCTNCHVPLKKMQQTLQIITEKSPSKSSGPDLAASSHSRIPNIISEKNMSIINQLVADYIYYCIVRYSIMARV